MCHLHEKGRGADWRWAKPIGNLRQLQRFVSRRLPQSGILCNPLLPVSGISEQYTARVMLRSVLGAVVCFVVASCSGDAGDRDAAADARWFPETIQECQQRGNSYDGVPIYGCKCNISVTLLATYQVCDNLCVMFVNSCTPTTCTSDDSCPKSHSADGSVDSTPADT